MIKDQLSPLVKDAGYLSDSPPEDLGMLMLSDVMLPSSRLKQPRRRFASFIGTNEAVEGVSMNANSVSNFEGGQLLFSNPNVDRTALHQEKIRNLGGRVKDGCV
jgi:hypothetical protein